MLLQRAARSSYRAEFIPLARPHRKSKVIPSAEWLTSCHSSRGIQIIANYQLAAPDIPDVEWPRRPSSHLFAVRNNDIWTFLSRNTGNISRFLLDNICLLSALPSCGEPRSVCCLTPTGTGALVLVWAFRGEHAHCGIMLINASSARTSPFACAGAASKRAACGGPSGRLHLEKFALILS